MATTGQLKHDVRRVSAEFDISGEYVSAEPYGRGHINDTYAVTFRRGGATCRYIVQHVNQTIFKDPVALMENVHRVTTHQHHKLRTGGCRDTDRRALKLVPTRKGASHLFDESGNPWRVYLFIERATSYDTIQHPRQARQAAKAFGEFQAQLADMPGGRVRETIPDFHNTPKRFEVLEKAIQADVCNRAKDVKREIEFALKRKPITGVLIDKHRRGLIPERTTHNDTKMNNVLLDEETGEGICIIDLDTVMPGLSLYDFGDMVRSATNSAAEDEQDLSKVFSQMEVFKALVDGYLEAAHAVLTAAERDAMAFSGKLISFEIGIRFLTDYLAGDVYFKIHRPDQNRDRCRTQFKLVESIEIQEAAMASYVAGWRPHGH